MKHTSKNLWLVSFHWHSHWKMCMVHIGDTNAYKRVTQFSVDNIIIRWEKLWGQQEYYNENMKSGYNFQMIKRTFYNLVRFRLSRKFAKRNVSIKAGTSETLDIVPTSTHRRWIHNSWLYEIWKNDYGACESLIEFKVHLWTAERTCNPFRFQNLQREITWYEEKTRLHITLSADNIFPCIAPNFNHPIALKKDIAKVGAVRCLRNSADEAIWLFVTD